MGLSHLNRQVCKAYSGSAYLGSFYAETEPIVIMNTHSIPDHEKSPNLSDHASHPDRDGSLR